MGSKGKGKAQEGGRYRDLPEEEERIGDDPDETARWEQEEQQVRPRDLPYRHDCSDVGVGDCTPARRYTGHDIGDIVNTGISSWIDRSRSRGTERVSSRFSHGGFTGSETSDRMLMD